MTQKQIEALAMEYAKDYPNEIKFLHYSIAEKILQWLSDKCLIAEKSKVIELYCEAEEEARTGYYAQIKTSLAKRELIRKLFPEIFNQE